MPLVCLSVGDDGVDREIRLTSVEVRGMAAQLVRAADLLDFDGLER
jgi:hypothetical protein